MLLVLVLVGRRRMGFGRSCLLDEDERMACGEVESFGHGWWWSIYTCKAVFE